MSICTHAHRDAPHWKATDIQQQPFLRFLRGRAGIGRLSVLDDSRLLPFMCTSHTSSGAFILYRRVACDSFHPQLKVSDDAASGKFYIPLLRSELLWELSHPDTSEKS